MDRQNSVIVDICPVRDKQQVQTLELPHSTRLPKNGNLQTLLRLHGRTQEAQLQATIFESTLMWTILIS